MLKIRAYTQEELEKNVKNQVWFYLYVSNNGYLLFSGLLILFYKFTYEEFQKGYYLLYASGALFVVGTFAIISFIISTCKADANFFNIFYSYDLVKPLYKMPFASVRNFLFLKDKCCSCNKNNNPNEIGSPKCVCCCSYTTLIVKYFTLIITAIVYYGSLLFLTVILLIVISCFKIKGQKQDMNLEKENNTNEGLFSKKDDAEQNLIQNEKENVAENNNQEININNEENNFEN